ncbi:trypsin-like peptidase domain-containing protein [Paenibacillus filicis]|uniref:Trypsin-like peptidase domain-containing protein n=1 Tax=Paenibacillus gyeongsangnamensis TaxID=3388067 RepID=A0ABT4QL85_9BACL|nr:trypsin-like peptidase domain-containing protein [Paenibacillus filicis]MCZ8517636.1 trypsin-like peptidase domain-containing protein [Paenibacillus filicis]
MSLFDDDFYSTKTIRSSRQESWTVRRSARGWLPGWIMPAAGGAAVTALLFMLLGGHGGGPGKNAQPAVTVMAPPAGATVAGASGPGSSGSGESVIYAAEKVSPTVVSIIGSKKDSAKDATGKSGGVVGLGSGVIFAKAGDKVRIVTNNHVVEGFTQLDVVSSVGERRKATLVGRDQITDLAVLEMDGTGIKQTAEFGDSDSLKAGETVIAVGNPLGLGYAPTITKGIISWPKRTIPVSLGQEGELDWEMDVIQTDAAINQGNSGGALVDVDGKIIGINTLKVADTGVEGLGFAIPINQVKSVIDTLIQFHKVVRPYIGVVTQELQSFAGVDSLKLPAEAKKGIIVLDVTGPAKDAGLKSNDVITELDGKPINSTLSLRKYIYGQKKVGDKLAITYYRGSKKSSVLVTLGELKDR